MGTKIIVDVEDVADSARGRVWFRPLHPRDREVVHRTDLWSPDSALVAASTSSHNCGGFLDTQLLNTDIPHPSGSRCTSRTCVQLPCRSSMHLSNWYSTCWSDVREHRGRSRCSLGWYLRSSCWLSRNRWTQRCCVGLHQWQEASPARRHLGLDDDRGACRR